jgi:integrase
VQRKRKVNIYYFHSFQHSFVSFCAKARVPLAAVQSIARHGNPAMTRRESAARQAIHALPKGKNTLEKRVSPYIFWFYVADF